MGSRGAFLESGGFSAPAQWHTVDIISGIKVLLPKQEGKSASLPERSNTPATSYLLYKAGGTFMQLRVFGPDRIPQFDIDYHNVDGEKILHKHIYTNGIRGKDHLKLTLEEYQKYESFLKGR